MSRKKNRPPHKLRLVPNPPGPTETQASHDAGRRTSAGFVTVHSATLHTQPAEGGVEEVESALKRMEESSGASTPRKAA